MDFVVMESVCKGLTSRKTWILLRWSLFRKLISKNRDFLVLAESTKGLTSRTNGSCWVGVCVFVVLDGVCHAHPRASKAQPTLKCNMMHWSQHGSCGMGIENAQSRNYKGTPSSGSCGSRICMDHVVLESAKTFLESLTSGGCC